MALREIIILPDKQLRLVSKPVEKVTTEIRKLADDMFETMYEAPGIGLAAIQVAQPLRLITMDLAKREEDGETKPRPRVFINPEILSSSEEMSVYEEGCLSIPEYYEEVERPAKVRIRFTDLDGKLHEEDADKENERDWDDVGLEEGRRHFQPLDRAQHRDRRGDDAVAIEQRCANEAGRHDPQVALLRHAGRAQHQRS